jgi:glyoxylase-like metal-dependent hydrolase (beta-lactamase superfamily II)
MKARDLILTILLACAGCSTTPNPPDFDPINFDRASIGQIGVGAYLIVGTFEASRAPDGNTVVLDVQGGLVVFDTGRHAAHVQKIIDYARARDSPIVAVINSHWHLDHVSGNPALRDAYPNAAIYSNNAALSAALDAFLARGAESNRRRIAEGRLDPSALEDARTDLATYEARDRLHPTVSIEGNRTLTIGGRRLELHAAAGASAGDIWLYDPRAKLVVAGDLITLPAPFLDTACPSAWSAALDEILARPFEKVVPGHGRIMMRNDVIAYSAAFDALIACAGGSAEAASCAEGWVKGAASLQHGPETDGRAAREYAEYYVQNVLRSGSVRADCTL